MTSTISRTSSYSLSLRSKQLVILSALGLLFSCSSSFADDKTNTPASHPPDVDNTASAPGTPATLPLQGSVQKVELDLGLLRDIGLDLKQALKACSSLYDEVTTQPVRVITQPEVVGRGIIINIPVGTQPTGPVQPARKDRVDLAMSGITPIIALLKKNVDDYVVGNRQLEMSDVAKEKLQTQIKDWVIVVNNLSAMENELKQITQGPKYDNGAIAKQVAYMEQDIQKLDILRNEIYKVVRKEGKRSSK